MYLRHFALTRLPFETPAHTDELFASNARRDEQAHAFSGDLGLIGSD